jgi:hypothetical protein
VFEFQWVGKNVREEELIMPPQIPVFFIVGPLRTGSSLMARCMDDHPSVICLCESEINRALYQDYYLKLHHTRMLAHGLTSEEIIGYLNRKRQDDLASLMKWYSDVCPRMAEIYQKPELMRFGDKSPDFFQDHELLNHLAYNHQLIYTVRDPRAIYASIEAQDDESREDKDERWQRLTMNYLQWKPYLDFANLLVVRYEDLVREPRATMQTVYSHLSLPDSERFLEPFPRINSARFLWPTAIDWATGIARDFDVARTERWRTTLTEKQIDHALSNPSIHEFMNRFGYTS